MKKEIISLLAAIDQTLPNMIEGHDKISVFARSEWILGEEGKVFIRAGRRLLDPNGTELVKVVDMATIELYEEFQGKGLWSEILTTLEKHAADKGRSLFVENVFSEKIDGSLRRRGYNVKDENGMPYSYWKGAEEIRADHKVERGKPKNRLTP